MIILDTNVVSELMRTAPADSVVSWLRGQVVPLATTAVTVAEINYGIERLPDGRRKTDLQSAARRVFVLFGRQVLPFDLEAAEAYADVVSNRERRGTPIDALDAQIAAICLTSRSSLATRNIEDFEAAGVDLINPFAS